MRAQGLCETVVKPYDEPSRCQGKIPHCPPIVGVGQGTHFKGWDAGATETVVSGMDDGNTDSNADVSAEAGVGLLPFGKNFCGV